MRFFDSFFRYFIVSFLGFFCVIYQANSQNIQFRFKQTPTVLVDEKPLANAWYGGFNSPQISTIDVNFDGLSDLFIFDRSTYKTTIFIQQNNNWKYAPEYEFFFPKMEHWALLRDYDNDGKKDLFTGTTFGISVYKNISENGILKWKSMANPLKSLSLSTLLLNLKIDVTDIPAILDIDQDGDMDILNFAPFTGESVEFHKNFSMERYGISDSLVFEKVQSRYGNFSECSKCNELTFNENRCNGGRIEHAGSSLLIFDTNGDKNLDFVIGDVSCTNLINLVTSGNKESDSITRFMTEFPSQKPVDFYVFPAAFYEDVTFDGVPDLLVAPNLYANENNAVDFKKSLWLYQNNLKNNVPNFEFIQTDFLQNEGLDFGEMVQPIFVDADGDNDMDLFVSNAGELDENRDYLAKMYFLENIGTSDNPTFKLQNSDYLSFSSQKLNFLKVAFADLDNNQKPELVYTGFDTENRTTIFKILENFLPHSMEKLTDFNLEKIQNESKDIEVSIRAGDQPIFWDIDNDGDSDLFIGKYEGNLEYYENTYETTQNITFELRTEAAGGITDNFRKQSLAPVLADFEQDGKAELVTLDRSGNLQVYSDFTAQVFNEIDPKNNLIYNKIDRNLKSIYVGRNASLAVYENQDLVIGTGGGGLLYLEKMTEEEITSIDQINQKGTSFKIFPNPVSENLIVKLPNYKKAQLQILDIFGKVVLTQKTIPEQTQISVAHLPNGVYFLKLMTEKSIIWTQKMIISH